jgi:hypothetical protein
MVAAKPAANAPAGPEQQAGLVTLTLYVTNFDSSSVQRWGTPADAPAGRPVQNPAMFFAAQTPTLDHPVPTDPEVFLTIRSVDPTIWAGGYCPPGTAIQVKLVLPSSPLPAAELVHLPPRPVPGPTDRIA